MTITAWIDHWSDKSPERTYVIAPEPAKSVTYNELHDYVQIISSRLDAMGIEPGEHVATFMDNGLWTALLFLGVMASGRVIVPLNVISGDTQLEYVLDHCDANVLFASDKHLERARKISSAASRAINIIPSCTDTGPQWPDETVTAGRPSVLPEQDSPALLIYTSGTTGKPKGAVLTHRNVIGGGLNAIEAHQLTADDRALCVLPLYHINGEIVTTIAPLVSGGSVVLPHRFSAGAFWDLVMDHQCTWFSVVPTIVAYLLAAAEAEPQRIRSNPSFDRIRFGRSASSALPPDVHQAFEREFGIPMIETMGLSETAAQILSNPLPPTPCKYGSPGIAYRNAVKAVLEDGRDAPPGVSGEICVRGDNVLSHYYKNPEATEKALTEDGWLKTGDLGYQDEDGYFFITGRLKELIIKGGENIAPREIDETLLKHPAVLEAAAYADDDANYGQEVMACVILKPGKSATESELQALAREELGKFKAPKRIHIVRWLPKGPSGKVQRLRIPEVLDQLMTPPVARSSGV